MRKIWTITVVLMADEETDRESTENAIYSLIEAGISDVEVESVKVTRISEFPDAA